MKFKNGQIDQLNIKLGRVWTDRRSPAQQRNWFNGSSLSFLLMRKLAWNFQAQLKILYIKFPLIPWIDDNLGHTPSGLTQIGNIIVKILPTFTIFYVFYRLFYSSAGRTMDLQHRGWVFKSHWRQYSLFLFSSLNSTQWSLWSLQLPLTLPK